MSRRRVAPPNPPRDPEGNKPKQAGPNPSRNSEENKAKQADPNPPRKGKVPVVKPVSNPARVNVLDNTASPGSSGEDSKQDAPAVGDLTEKGANHG